MTNYPFFTKVTETGRLSYNMAIAVPEKSGVDISSNQ